MPLAANPHLVGADYFMLIGYFVLMLGIGAYFFRRMRGMKDYFSGGNRIPWWLSGASFYMSSFSVFGFVAYSALAYKFGWVAVTLFWVTVPATVFSVLLFAKRWRRARIDSPVEYLETRYSPAFRQFVAWQGIPVTMVDDALKLVAIGTFISVSLGLDMKQSMFWSGTIILLYTFMGGLWAVTVTDFIQFVVMAVAMLFLLPLSLARLSGSEQYASLWPADLASFFSTDYHWLYVALLAGLYCIAWSSLKWPLIQRYYCVANEREAIKVGWLVTGLNVVGPPLMLLPAVAAQHFLGDVPDKEVYPRLCIELLPAGILGLVIAAMFAATMSMLSSDYNACAGVLTNDVYRRLFRRDASQKELVMVGRLMTLLVGGFALGTAYLMSSGSGQDLFENMVTLFGIVTAPIGIPMILGLLSRRVSNLGALLGCGTGIVVGLIALWLCPEKLALKVGGSEDAVFFSVALGKEIVIFMATFIVTSVVTLFFSLIPPMGEKESERVDAFHRRLAMPIGQMEEDCGDGGSAGFSPFRVVGISMVCIALMLLAISPWVGGGLALGLTIGFGAALLAIGLAMMWMNRGVAGQDDS